MGSLSETRIALRHSLEVPLKAGLAVKFNPAKPARGGQAPKDVCFNRSYCLCLSWRSGLVRRSHGGDPAAGDTALMIKGKGSFDVLEV